MAIGDIKAPNTAVAPTNTQVTADDFGAGVGRSFDQLGSSVNTFGQSLDQHLNAQQSLKTAQTNRANKSLRATIDTKLLRFNAETERELARMRTENPVLTVEDYDAQTEKFLRSRVDAFAKQIPQHLQEEYMPKLEGIVQSGVTKAFNFDNQQRTVEYQAAVSESSVEMVNSILSGATSPRDWDKTIDDLIENSVLPQAETAVLRADLEKQLQAAHFQREVNLAATQPHLTLGSVPGAVADGSDVVAAGLPAVMRGALNATASVEASGYDVRNGGSKITDFSKHPGPGKAPGGTSSAAGRYQFIYGTWMQAKEALGLTDFSPESQDRAAVWLAERDYRSRTGRNIFVDLESGDPFLIEQVRVTLAGTGSGENAKGVTWKGLQNMKPEKFYQMVTSSHSTPSALVYDPRFAAVPFDTKMQYAEQAERAAAQQRAADQTAQEAAVSQMYERLMFSIAAGDAGKAEIDEFTQEHNLDYNQYDKLVSAFEERNAQQISSQQFASVLSSPNPEQSFVNDEQGRKSADNFYRGQILGGVSQQDPVAQQALVEMVSRVPYVPQSAQTQLQNMMYSPNPNEKKYALETMLQMQKKSPYTVSNAFSDDVVKDLLTYEAGKGLLTEEELLATVTNDPKRATVIDFNEEQADKYINGKETAKNFTGVKLASRLGFDEAPVDVYQQQALQQEGMFYYKYFYGRLGNEKAAWQATEKRMLQTWGEVGITGADYIMKYPPSVAKVPQFNGSWDYIDTQIRRDYGLDAETEIRLIPVPNVTDTAVTEQRDPSYGFMLKTAEDYWEPQWELDENGDPTGFPALFFPEIHSEMKELQDETAIYRQSLHVTEMNLQQEKAQLAQLENLQNIRTFSGAAGEVVHGEFPRLLNEQRARVEELETQRAEIEENAPASLEAQSRTAADQLREEFLEDVRGVDPLSQEYADRAKKLQEDLKKAVQ